MHVAHLPTSKPSDKFAPYDSPARSEALNLGDIKAPAGRYDLSTWELGHLHQDRPHRPRTVSSRAARLQKSERILEDIAAVEEWDEGHVDITWPGIVSSGARLGISRLQ